MKKLLAHITLITLILVTASFFLVPQPAYAFNLGDITLSVIGWLANTGMSAAGGFLAITGVLLNGSMAATLHMKDIVAATPAIETVWKIVRDFSNIFIIFMLLYASISMILERKGLSFNELLKNIILSALLINFSLFFTKVAFEYGSRILSM